MAGYSGKIAKYWEDTQENIFDYAEDVEKCHKIFKEREVKNVLDVGCGTGKHLRLLTKLGYKCTGIDKSKEMLEVAREKAEEEGLKIEFIECDMRDIKIKKNYDAIICMYVITQPEIEDVKKGFRSIHKVLKENGVLVFNVMNTEGGSQEFQTPLPFPSIPMFEMKELLEKDNVKIISLDNLLMRNPIQDWTAVHLIEEGGKLSMEIYHQDLRLFHLEEIKDLLKECGFKFELAEHRQIKEVKELLICASKPDK